MSIRTRIASVHRSGNRRDAVTLAREALSHDDVDEVTIGAEVVTVETTHFTGTHAIDGFRGGEVVVAQDGEYTLRGDSPVTFETRTMYDNAFEKLVEAEADLDPDALVEADADADATGARTPRA